MLDENLPTFYIKAATSDNPLSSTIYLTQNASELNPEYSLRRPDPSTPASKNCYAVALYDSYSPDVLYAEVLVQPEWTQPTLSQAEIRAQNGIPPPPVPIVPNKFTIQLYNPDQQVTVRQIEGKWNSSSYWEFEMPQNTFRRPSGSTLDRTQDDPAASDITPKIGFKWKRDGKLSKDISCYLSGKVMPEGKKNKEPDIIIAMYKTGKDQNSLTLYEPNMHRVDVEDFKGLEVVLMLSSAVIKDVFFNPSREMFNISSPPSTTQKRKNSGPVIGGRKSSGSGAIMTGALSQSPVQNIPQSQIPPPQPYRQPQPQQKQQQAPPAVNPRTQWEIDAETARLKAMVEAEEKERERQERAEQKRIKKMLEAEEKERLRREAEVAKETERLRKQYGVPAMPPPRVQFQPSLPVRPQAQLPNGQYAQQPNGQFHQQPPPQQGPQRPMSSSSVSRPTQQQPHASLGTWLGRTDQQQTPYLQAPGQGTASSSGFFGLGGGKKVQKKRSVFF
ncbi:hypothetical protein GLAREA_06691 [Glarea lozoyensis ATCC 20868]|uniref:Uncharacterized protein n=1 Tax=Glarea lozoyensis (strain ATCC 20868 / MF5171) TaxID=1116229 RepID=S3E5M0_GLAL2|nr:uncharacterized protein GLAREA_06691 [Glarea lozoyensis ATCC 20868]EPE33678.1 hypothetical protein GLAREA_06691 [Glarea lozoyensis ATCC 20868]